MVIELGPGASGVVFLCIGAGIWLYDSAGLRYAYKRGLMDLLTDGERSVVLRVLALGVAFLGLWQIGVALWPLLRPAPDLIGL